MRRKDLQEEIEDIFKTYTLQEKHEDITNTNKNADSIVYKCS